MPKSIPHLRRALLVAGTAMSVVVTLAGPAAAADRAAFIAACEKDPGTDAKDKVKCACVADKVDAAFKGKELAFSFDSLSKPIGEVAAAESGLTEAEEDTVIDKTFAAMKDCGLAK